MTYGSVGAPSVARTRAVAMRECSFAAVASGSVADSARRAGVAGRSVAATRAWEQSVFKDECSRPSPPRVRPCRSHISCLLFLRATVAARTQGDRLNWRQYLRCEAFHGKGIYFTRENTHSGFLKNRIIAARCFHGLWALFLHKRESYVEHCHLVKLYIFVIYTC